MKIIPAIDLIAGQCVRLTEGDFDRLTTYERDPLSLALEFEQVGCQQLHLVDLEGAKAGNPQNLRVLEEISSNTKLEIDFSGGIRKTVDVESAFSAGAAKVAVGSIAQRSPDTFRGWLQDFGKDRFILSADVRNERIAISGWQEQTSVSLYDFIESFSLDNSLDTATITDISKDGKMQGPGLALYTQLRERFPELKLIASGGVRSIADLKKLDSIGMHGAIVGKALYENGISLAEIEDYICSQNA